MNKMDLMKTNQKLLNSLNYVGNTISYKELVYMLQDGVISPDELTTAHKVIDHLQAQLFWQIDNAHCQVHQALPF